MKSPVESADPHFQINWGGTLPETNIAPLLMTSLQKKHICFAKCGRLKWYMSKSCLYIYNTCLSTFASNQAPHEMRHLDISIYSGTWFNHVWLHVLQVPVPTLFVGDHLVERAQTLSTESVFANETIEVDTKRYPQKSPWLPGTNISHLGKRKIIFKCSQEGKGPLQYKLVGFSWP